MIIKIFFKFYIWNNKINFNLKIKIKFNLKHFYIILKIKIYKYNLWLTTKIGRYLF